MTLCWCDHACVWVDFCLSDELDVMNDRTKTFFTLSRKSKTDVRDQQFQTLCEVHVSST